MESNELIEYVSGMQDQLPSSMVDGDADSGRHSVATTQFPASVRFSKSPIIFYIVITLCSVAVPVYYFTLVYRGTCKCDDLFIGIQYANWYLERMTNFSDDLQSRNNICVRGRQPITVKTLPKMLEFYTNLTENKFCEQVYNLGESDLVFACIERDNVINVYFTTFTARYGYVHYILTWRQYCA